MGSLVSCKYAPFRNSMNFTAVLRAAINYFEFISHLRYLHFILVTRSYSKQENLEGHV